VELLLILVFGLIAGMAIGNAVGTMRAARGRRPRDLAVDAELQSARQRAERAAGEAQACRTKLAAAEVLTARVAKLDADRAAADEDAERNAELARRLESELAALRIGRRDGSAEPGVAAKGPAVIASAHADREGPVSSGPLEPIATTEAEEGSHAAHEAPPDGPEHVPHGPSPSATTVAVEVGEPWVVERSVVKPVPVFEPVPVVGADADVRSTAPWASEASVIALVPATQPSAPPDAAVASPETTGRGAGTPTPPTVSAEAARPAPTQSAGAEAPTPEPPPTRAAPTRARQRHQPASPLVVEPVAPPESAPDPDPAPAPEVGPQASDAGPAPEAPPPAPGPAPMPEVRPQAPHPRGWQPIRPGLSDPWTWLGTAAPTGIPYAEDDLQRIHGVGPYLARRLREEGVLTWRQVAEWDEDDMTHVSRRIGSFPDRIRREDWSGTARELHEATYGDRLP